MKKYIFAIDIDRTLVQAGVPLLSEESTTHLAALIDEGHHLVLCTGRNHSASVQVLTHLDRPFYVLSSYGSVARLQPQNKILFTDTISSENLKKLENAAIKHKFVGAQTRLTDEAERTEIICGQEKLAAIFLKSISQQSEIRLPEHIVSNQASSSPILRFVWISEISSRENLQKASQEFLSQTSGLEVGLFDDPRYGISTATFTSQSANKGKAIQRLASLLELPCSQVLAFGDNHTDVPMLEIAGRALLVEDHTIQNPQFVFELIASANQNGVTQFIQKWLKSSN